MIFTKKNIISLVETESTNNYAMALVSDKYCEGTVVLAQYQVTGRGQAGSYWESEAGKNLLFSLILEPKFLDAAKQFYLSMAVSLALVQMLKQHISEVSIKWPNDIYSGGKKIAGILIENTVKGSSLDRSVVGIGLNVNQEKFVSDAPNPVSMKQLSGKEYPLIAVLDEFLQLLDHWYILLKQYDFKQIEEGYFTQLFRNNGWHQYRDSDGEFTAKIVGIGEFGKLLLEDQSGKIRTYMFKEVEFIL